MYDKRKPPPSVGWVQWNFLSSLTVWNYTTVLGLWSTVSYSSTAIAVVHNRVRITVAAQQFSQCQWLYCYCNNNCHCSYYSHCSYCSYHSHWGHCNHRRDCNNSSYCSHRSYFSCCSTVATLVTVATVATVASSLLHAVVEWLQLKPSWVWLWFLHTKCFKRPSVNPHGPHICCVQLSILPIQRGRQTDRLVFHSLSMTFSASLSFSRLFWLFCRLFLLAESRPVPSNRRAMKASPSRRM